MSFKKRASSHLEHVGQGLLHRLAGPHDRHAANVVLGQGDPVVRVAVRRLHGHGLVRQERERVLHQEAHEALAVEDELVAARLAGPDVRVHPDDLAGRGENVDVGRERLLLVALVREQLLADFEPSLRTRMKLSRDRKKKQHSFQTPLQDYCNDKLFRYLD